jgi:hypothetical protein
MTEIDERRGNSPYEEIFAEVESPSDLRRAIARAVRQLREAMEKEDNSAVTAAHVRNLKEIDAEALALAYALAEETCTYWPSPGQIRELAGWSEESKAGIALQWVLNYLQKHGVEGRPRGGAATFGDDETGRRVLLRTAPMVAAPAIPGDIETTLALLGGGAARQGLRWISQHPLVKQWDGFASDTASKAAERIEQQWTRCYRQVMRKTRREQALTVTR